MKRLAYLLVLALLLPLAAAQDQLNTAIGSNPPTLDPQKTFNGFSFAITNQIYETLFVVTPEGEIEGLLADEWEYLDENRLQVRLVEGGAFVEKRKA